MLFMNEEGTEQGGLIWGAHEDANGRVDGRVHLSVDQYEENQIFAIDAGQDGNEKFSQLAIIDQGDYPISEKRATNDKIARLPPAQRDAAWRQFFATHRHDVRRLMLGRSPDGSVGLELRDSRGKVRAVFAVEPNGNPVLRLLDENGKVVKAVTIN
jgi:hypothetical protein